MCKFNYNSSFCDSVVPVYTSEFFGWRPRDLLPDLDQGFSELLDSLWWYLVSSDALTYGVPYLLSWISSRDQKGQSVPSLPRKAGCPVLGGNQDPLNSNII